MRVAIVHDWLSGMRGGEKVLEVLSAMYPEADIYTLFYLPEKIAPGIRNHKVIESSFAALPGLPKYYRHLLPLFPLAAKSLSSKIARAHAENPYSLVISVSHCFAKNVTAPEGVAHLCYCLSPMRYIWDQYDAYFAGRTLEPLIRQIVKPLRRWDRNCAKGVTKFAGISEFIKQRIERVYGEQAEVVFPPVAADWIDSLPREARGERFLSVNALVPYKNTHIIIEAFNKLGLPLTLVGSGPEKKRLQNMAGANIEFLEDVSAEELAKLYKSARAFVFAAEEDFGITPLEAQAAGAPVVAYGRGGALETVVAEGEEKTGVFYSESNAEHLCSAIQYFLDHEGDFSVDCCMKQASGFSQLRFEAEFRALVEDVLGGEFAQGLRQIVFSK